MIRAGIYIDGRNFFHGLEGIGFPGDCFNFKKFAEENLCAGKRGNPGKEVAFIKYFAAHYPRDVDERKHLSDEAHFQSLKNLGVQVFLGRMQKGDRFPSGQISLKEKGVDTRLVVELLVDAFHGSFEHAYILSSDTDIVPAIRKIKEMMSDKKIFAFGFQKPQDFIQSCDACVQIYPDVAKKYVEPTTFRPSAGSISNLTAKFNNKRI